MSEGVLWCTKQREQARHPCVNTEGALRARGQHTITTFLEGYSGERERERDGGWQPKRDSILHDRNYSKLMEQSGVTCGAIQGWTQ